MPTQHHWITTPVTAAIVRGALELEQTAHGLLPHRLPARARAQCADGQLAMAEAQPSGVRLAFRTRATAVELDTLPTKRVYLGVPPRPDGVYDLLVDGRLTGQATVAGGNTLTIDMATGSAEHQAGPPSTVRFTGLPGGEKHVEIWLPHNERTELLALRTDAPIEPAPDRGSKVWLHHGSSISHGSDAASPSTTWPALAAGLGGVELINLGLGGSALLDPFTARPAGHSRGPDQRQDRHQPGQRRPDAPARLHPRRARLPRHRPRRPSRHTAAGRLADPLPDPRGHARPQPPDPAALSAGQLRFRAAGDPAERASGKLSLGVIRDELARIVAQRSAEDPQLHHLDGRELYGQADFAELPLPDELHPDAATHRRMGERFAELAFGGGGPFAEGGA